VAELRPKLSKSTKLASELLTATGLVCLRVIVLAGHTGHSRITIGGIADRDTTCKRLWFHSARAAERVIAELYRTHGLRRGADMVIDAVPDEADRLLRASARLIGVYVLDDESIDSMLESLSTRAAAAINKMPRRQRTIKALRPVLDLDLTGLLARQSM
jgi:hypothetical protein